MACHFGKEGEDAIWKGAVAICPLQPVMITYLVQLPVQKQTNQIK